MDLISASSGDFPTIFMALNWVQYPMTDPWCWYIHANIIWGYLGVFLDGIHGATYIAAPLGSYGYGYNFMGITLYLVGSENQWKNHVESQILIYASLP